MELNLHEPFLPGYKIPRKNLATNKANGSKLWVEMKYARLFEFCFNYSILDHFAKDCNLYTDMRHQVNDSNLVPIIREWRWDHYEAQSPMSFFLHMDGPNHNSEISFHHNNPPFPNIVGPFRARLSHGASVAYMIIHDTTEQRDYSYSTSSNMHEKISEKAKRIHPQVQEIIQIFQILGLINFITFFHNWYFKYSDFIVDMNLHFKMML